VSRLLTATAPSSLNRHPTPTPSRWSRCSRPRDRGVGPPEANAVDRFTLRKESNVFSNLHVGNLTFDTTAADLRTLFAQQGEVKEAQVVTDLHSGRSRGFGFVEMATPDEAKTAISALDGFNVDGRDMTVAIAKPRSR